jgi:hypothetical protein
MSLKKHLAKRYIPSSTKWKLVLKGVGKLYRAIYDELEKDDRDSSAKALADASYRVGLDFGETLKKDFGLGNSIEDVAFAMEIDHDIWCQGGGG